MLINKAATEQSPTLAVNNFNLGMAEVYRYSAADLTRVVRLADLAFAGGSVQPVLPAASITLLVVSPGAFPPGDFDHDSDVDIADVQHFAGCAAGPGQAVSGSCADTDLDGDGDADQSDFGILQRCLSGSGIAATLTCGQ